MREIHGSYEIVLFQLYQYKVERVVMSSNKKQEQETDEEKLISLYRMHQNQFQQAYNIITAIGMGWMAAIGLIYTADYRPLWLKLLSCFFAFLCVHFEYVGIKKTRKNLDAERNQILIIGGTMSKYASFLDMPRELIGLSDILLIFETRVFAFLFVATLLCNMACIKSFLKERYAQFLLIVFFSLVLVAFFIVEISNMKKEIKQDDETKDLILNKKI